MNGFKNKIGKFGSLVSLIAITAMIILFASSLPVFMGSTAGQVFVGIWACFALIMFAAHAIRLAAERQHQAAIMPLMARTKDARTRKNIRRVRADREG